MSTPSSLHSQFVSFVLMAILSLLLSPSAMGQEQCEEYTRRTVHIGVSTGATLAVRPTLVDQDGRRTGVDHQTGQVLKEIPCQSGYGVETIDYHGPPSDPRPPHTYPTPTIMLRPTGDSDFTLKLYGLASSALKAEISTRDQSGESATRVVTAAVRQGDTLEIQFQYDADDATQLSTSIDLFEGKGQRPRDVNKFLSYHGPMEMKTTVASGTSSYDVAIYYGDTIDPSSFEAEFNKQDVTDLFSPEAGKAEIVQLPLDKKRNTLVVSVDGVRDDGKTATDSDRLVFIVE